MRESRLKCTTNSALRLVLMIVSVALCTLQFTAGSVVAARSGVGDSRYDVVGSARVIDGDTLDVAGVRVRLEGIDAPERGQKCRRASWTGLWKSGQWRCGRAATRALERLIAKQAVRCRAQGHDKYGRVIGVCFANGKNINAQMVRAGHAWAFVKYSKSFVAEEAAARHARRGIWQAETQTAWEFRAKKWTASEQQAPNGCAIKGNISARGKIYHMPWSPWYTKVRIAPNKGERWFCSEADARQAGWRPVGAI
ncbi:MAG: thermonuclease family protein [Alphaproteobacteria bacterium]|nr:thermonuclease family protein [Alphaproteobacteria bacterium]